MSVRNLYFLVLSGLFCWPVHAYAQAPATDLLIDSLYQRYAEGNRTHALAIGVIDRGKTSSYFYGNTGQEGDSLPDRETIFELGELTQIFTAELLKNRVDSGAVKLTDSIINYLPDSVAANPQLKGITFWDLAVNSSGLTELPSNLMKGPDFNERDPFNSYPVDSLMAFLSRTDSTGFPYQIGYGLIGELLARSEHSSYNELIQQYVAQPLGMSGTTEFPLSDAQQHFIPSFDSRGHLTPHWHFASMSASGALKSKLSDLLRFANQFLKRKDHRGASGLYVREEGDVALFWRYGKTTGSRSFTAFSPKKNVALVILANSAHEIDSLVNTLMEHLIGIQPNQSF